MPKKVRWELAVAVIVAILLVVSIGLVVSAWFAWTEAKDKGSSIGNTAGKVAGLAAGSFDGVTKGLKEGYDEGKEEGLSAEDTDAEIASKIQMVGRLEVLEAEDQLIDNHEQGNDYKALFVYKVKATFSVNLEDIEVESDANAVTVILPALEVDIAIDENGSEKLAEWQKFFWSGSREDGYIAYMNSMAQMKEKSADEIKKNDYLMEQAEESAKKQVKILAKSICNKKVNVIFAEEKQ